MLKATRNLFEIMTMEAEPGEWLAWMEGGEHDPVVAKTERGAIATMLMRCVQDVEEGVMKSLAEGAVAVETMRLPTKKQRG